MRFMCRAEASVKLKKCKFLANTNEHLGRVILFGRLELVAHITDAVVKLEH